MTKAERIFKDTYYASMSNIKTWGFDESTSWTRLNTEETVCTRTLNAIDKLIEKEQRGLDLNKKLGCFNDFDQLREQALTMVRNTVKAERRNLAELATI